MLDHIRIILDHTSHPGNIGSVARAMKTMGLHHLYLVSPKAFPHQKAQEMASGAFDILEAAMICDSLDESLKDATLVIGTSSRMRTIPWPLLTPREMAEKIKCEPKTSTIAILFGCEQSGLNNDALQRCHYHIHIPANPDYSSLNLAAAVQIIAYELRLSHSNPVLFANTWDYRLATADEMEKFFVHLQATLEQIEFLKPNAPRKLMSRLRRLFLRVRPDVMEMNILRGMLSAIFEAKGKEK